MIQLTKVLGFTCSVMDNVLASGMVGRCLGPRSGKTNEYQIGICCLSAKHAALMSKIKDWLAWNQDNVTNWCDMSIRGSLFQ